MMSKKPTFVEASIVYSCIALLIAVFILIVAAVAYGQTGEPKTAPPVTDDHDREFQPTIDDIYRRFGLIDEQISFMDNQMLDVVDGADDVVDGSEDVRARKKL